MDRHERDRVDHPADVAVVRPGQHREVAEAIVQGHADYPAFRHVFPDPDRRSRCLRPFFRATVHDAISFESALAVTVDSVVAGAAVWLPPGAFPWSVSRKLRTAPAFARVLAAYPRAFPTFCRYGANAERAHPREPHWYLVVLSVRPEFQRRGLGSRLVEPVLQQADAAEVPCYLETSDPANIPFYERFGFTVLDPALPLVPGGPTHTSMWRRVSGG